MSLLGTHVPHLGRQGLVALSLTHAAGGGGCAAGPPGPSEGSVSLATALGFQGRTQTQARPVGFVLKCWETGILLLLGLG